MRFWRNAWKIQAGSLNVEYLNVCDKQPSIYRMNILHNKKDQRTYKVNFDKVYKYFKNDINFKINIKTKLKNLLLFYKRANLSMKNFNGRKTVRLIQLRYLIKRKKF